MYRTGMAVVLTLLSLGHAAPTQAALPVVEEVAWEPFRTHCREVLRMLDASGAPLPAKTTHALRTLLDNKTDDPQAAARAVQKLLDAWCLLGVDINPESRVKAARGQAMLVLHRNQATMALVKVHNEGGVTHRLRLRGPGITSTDEGGAGRWLRAVLVTDAASGPALSGRRLEYRLLRLTPREAGKREATFQFDVGQGSQDLGFRAEVPILFSIRETKRKD